MSDCPDCYATNPAEYPEPGAGFGMVKCVLCGQVWDTEPALDDA